MDNADVESGVPAGHTPADRNSAATIDHTEVHVDLNKTGKPAITTGESAVAYNTGEPGQTTVIVQTKPDPGAKPKDFVVTSCLVIMFCNFIFGLLGYHWGSKYTLKCLSIGTPHTTTFPFVPNREWWFLGVPIFKHIRIRL